MYFDADRLSAMDSYRKCSYCKEYDADVHAAAAICPDSFRNIMNNSDHSTIIKKAHYADSKLRTEISMIRITPQCNPEMVNTATYINGKPICKDKNGYKYS